MRKITLKKITSIILVLFLSISTSLNNTSYSSEFNIISVLNSNSIESYSDARIEDDFYNAVNKEWLSKVKLDDGYISYGTFEEVCGRVNGDILNIISDIQKNKDNYDKNSDELKVLNLYNNYLDMKKRDELGTKPLEKYMNQINEIKDTNDLKAILKDDEFSYFQPLINLGVGPDYKNSNINVLYVSRSNLGLGNSFYYKDTSEKSQKIKQIYIDYIAKLHMLYGENEDVAKKNAETFFNIENEFAKKIPSYEEEAKDENRIQNSYNLYTVKELNKLIPNADIPGLLNKLNINNPKKIIVENPEELKLVNSLISKDNLENIKTYFKTNVLMNTDNYLTSKHREACNELRKVLYGVECSDLDEGSGVKFVSGQLNEIISKLYVNKHFDDESKNDVEKMSKEIIENFEDRLQSNTWMSKSTKEKALRKLEMSMLKWAILKSGMTIVM